MESNKVECQVALTPIPTPINAPTKPKRPEELCCFRDCEEHPVANGLWGPICYSHSYRHSEGAQAYYVKYYREEAKVQRLMIVTAKIRNYFFELSADGDPTYTMIYKYLESLEIEKHMDDVINKGQDKK